MRTVKLCLHALVGFALMFSTLTSALLTAPLVANAATVGLPSSIGYQGRLKTAAGVAVSDAARSFTFQFCTNSATTATCTEPVGSAIVQSLTTAGGYFSTNLSTSEVSSYFASGNLYLQITVASEILNPTVQVFASPYAMSTRAVEQLAEDPAVGAQSSYAGRIYYDTVTNLFKFYDAGASAWVAVAGTLNGATLGVDNSAATAINVGTGAVAKAITIGNGTGTTSLTLNAGSGNIDIGNTAGGRTINIAGSSATGTDTINIGGGSSGADAINIGNANNASTILIGGANGSFSTNAVSVSSTNWRINAVGFLTLGDGQGVDNAAGASTGLSLGYTNSTLVNIGTMAATAINIGNGQSLTRTIAIGTGTGQDTINIGTGVGTADVIAIGSSTNPWKITGPGVATLTGASVDGTIEQTVNSITSGNGLSVASSSTGLTGSLQKILLSGNNVSNTGDLLNLTSSGASSLAKALNVTVASTGTLLYGGVHFDFTGDHTGNGFRIDDQTTAGNTLALASDALTSGNEVYVTSNTTALTGDLQEIALSGNSASNTGNLLNLTSSGTSSIAKALSVNVASTGTFAGGNVSLNFYGAHTGNAIQIDDITTSGQVMTLNANSLAGGSGFNINSSSTGLVGSLQNIALSGDNASNTGDLLNLTSSGILSRAKALSVTINSLGYLPQGGVRFNFAGDHTGDGFRIDDLTTDGNVMDIHADSLTNGRELYLSSSSTALNGNLQEIRLYGDSASNTGDLLNLTSSGASSLAKALNTSIASTGNLANGGVRFQFTGEHTGNGLQIDDVTLAGNAVALNATALRTGKALSVGMGDTLTTGSALNISGAIYAHTEIEQASLASLAFTDATSVAASSNTYGLMVSPTINATSGAVSRNITGIQVSPFLTACSFGSCNVEGIRIEGVTDGAGFTGYGLSIGSGWDVGIMMSSKIDMNGSLIENIGDSGTDFISGGGLTLASTFTANGDIVLGNASSDTLSVNPATLSFTNDTAHTIKNADSAADTVGRALTIQGGFAGVGATIGQVGGAISINGGNGSLATGAFTSGNGALVSIAGGTGADSTGATGTAGNGGAVQIDAGVAGATNTGTAGSNGSINIGITNASSLVIGNSTASTQLTMNGGNKWSVDGTTGNIVTAGKITQSATGASGYGVDMLTGAWSDGMGTTNTKPHLLIEPTGTTSTGWTNAGTALGINANSTSYDGSLIDAQVNGVSKFKVMNSTNDVVTVNAGTEQYDNMSAMNISMTGYHTTGNALIKLNPAYASVTTGQTFDVMKISAFTAAATGGVITDTVNGFSIGALTQTETGGGVITSTAMNIGSGWDTGISLQHGGTLNDYYTGGAYGQMQISAASGVNTGGDQMIMSAGSGGSGATSGDGGVFSISGGQGGVHTIGSGKNGGGVTINAGSGTNAAGGFGGNGGNGGNILIDAGEKGLLDGAGSDGTNGTVSIGATYASSVDIGTNAPVVNIGSGISGTGIQIGSNSNSIDLNSSAWDLSSYGILAGKLRFLMSSNDTGISIQDGSAWNKMGASIGQSGQIGLVNVAAATYPLYMFNGFAQPTIEASAATTTFTDAATMYIANGPTAGTNAAITNSYALLVAAGKTKFGGDVAVEGALDMGTQDSFVADDVTPSVAGGSFFNTVANGGGALNITNFDDGVEGQIITIIVANATNPPSFDCDNTSGSTDSLQCGATDFSTGVGDTVSWINAGSGIWHLLGWMRNGGTQLGDDLAEWFPATEDIQAGDVVVSSSSDPVHISKSTSGYQKALLGIISTQPGLILGEHGASQFAAQVALSGRVPVKVTNENGSIEIGDYLTSSATQAGFAMKATAPGPVIGIAMESFNLATGSITVKVDSSWYTPPTSLQGGSSLQLSVLSGDISVANATFSGSVTVAEHIYGSHDMAGRVRLISGKNKVHVTFEKAYPENVTPIVTFSSRSAAALGAWVSDEGPAGFDINRSDDSAQVEYNWMAVGVNDALVTVSNGEADVAISVNDLSGPVAPAPVVVVSVPPVLDPIPVVDPTPIVDSTPVVEPTPAADPVADPVVL